MRDLDQTGGFSANPCGQGRSREIPRPRDRGTSNPYRVVLGLVLLLFLVALGVRGQQVHRNSFEGRNPSWEKGPSDAECKELAHDMTDQTAHTGQLSEHIQLNAEVGSHIHYLYPVGRAPVGEELNVSLWVKANRPGMQIMARVVLPRERNGGKLDEPLTCLIRGDMYQMVGRWERLDLRRPVKRLREQQQFLRAELRRDVDIGDAYVDSLVLNVYGGPGMTELWLDDLEIGPVADTDAGGRTKTETVPGGVSRPTSRVPAVGRNALVQIEPPYLTVSGKPFLVRGIRHTNTPLKVLRDAGFNTIWLPSTAPDNLIEEAVNFGFWLAPGLPVVTNGSPSQASEQLGRDLARFLATDAVLFWDLGGGRTIEEAPLVARALAAVKTADPQRPVAVDVWDGFGPYSRQLDLIGAHRWPLMTSLELMDYREWLNQRRLLALAGQPRSSYQWTWVQTHLPDWYLALVYDRPKDAGGRPTAAPFQEPIGPQPEQIRLLTYISLAAGCHGLGFWSDRFLADSYQGRDRLLGLALLNQELQMLEPMLLSVNDQPTWIDTSKEEVKAIVFRTKRGMLVLPMWLGKGAQYVPGQSAGSKISMTVPQVPNGTQAWEISPGDVRSLPTERVVEGTKITLPEFGLTAAVVFTADNGPTGLVDHFQRHARRTRRLAAQWSHDLAEVEIDKVSQVEMELERSGHTLPDAAALMDSARRRLQASTDQWNNGDFRQSYHESQRALRPLRILMRAQWDKATLALDTPTASPYTLGFYTLPRHWELARQIQQSVVGANVLPDGDFEERPNGPPFSWLPQEVSLDDLELRAWRIGMERDVTPHATFDKLLKGPSGPSPNVTNPLPSLPGLSASPARANAAAARNPTKLTEKEKKKIAKEKATREKALGPKEGERCLKLQIKPKAGGLAPAALERTFLAVNSPAVHLQPGTLVRITVWMRVLQPITSGVDGALFFDSAGGEPLAVRQANPMPWKRFCLYRRVPASGTISVTCALTGIGTAYFDDVRIEPLSPGHATVATPLWRRENK